MFRNLILLSLLITVLCCGCTSFLHDKMDDQDLIIGGHSEGQGSGI